MTVPDCVFWFLIVKWFIFDFIFHFKIKVNNLKPIDHLKFALVDMFLDWFVSWLILEVICFPEMAGLIEARMSSARKAIGQVFIFTSRRTVILLAATFLETIFQNLEFQFVHSSKSSPKQLVNFIYLLSQNERLWLQEWTFWSKQWENLNENNKGKNCLTVDQVSEKLLFSLACYQPKALSRWTIPLSPWPDQMLEISQLLVRCTQSKPLPFAELKTCTATKQNHQPLLFQ